MKIALHLDAGHTTTGNPKRVYVVLDERADIVEVIDEGYAGRGELTKKYGRIPTIDFDTTSGEYRRLLRRRGV